MTGWSSFAALRSLHIYKYHFWNFYIYFWLCWVFVAEGFSVVAATRGYSLAVYAGFSLQWLLVAEHRLQARRLQQLGAREQAQ